MNISPYVFPGVVDRTSNATKARSIINEIVEYKGITLEQLCSEGRLTIYAHARFLCMYFLKYNLDFPLHEIARLLRGQNKPLHHSTIINGLRTVHKLMEAKDEVMKKDILYLKGIL